MDKSGSGLCPVMKFCI